MIAPLPSGLVRSIALLGGAALSATAAAHFVIPVLAASDLASVAALVGGAGLVAWAAASVAPRDRLSPAQAFAVGLALPVSAAFLSSPRARAAANDNDHPFNGSWPQFISE